MASPSVVQLSNTRNTNVVPFTTLPPQEISRLELTTLLSLRNRAKQIEADIADAERSIKERLEAGAYVEPGEHTAALRESSRRSVSWREVATDSATNSLERQRRRVLRARASLDQTNQISVAHH